jgi:hypothetical protein
MTLKLGILVLLVGVLAVLLYAIDRWSASLDHTLEVAVLERHYPDTVVLFREDGFVVTMPVPAHIYHRVYPGQHLSLELWHSAIFRRSWLTIHPLRMQTKEKHQYETMGADRGRAEGGRGV